MTNKIFVIKNEQDNCIKIFNDLLNAKNELKNIFNKTMDYKHYGYEIIEYDLIDNEYIISKTSFTYMFNEFATRINK
jgi:hypothetical protein